MTKPELPVEVVVFEDATGRSPFLRWLNSLDEGVRPRILQVLVRLRQGNLSSAKSVGSGVSELRLDWGPGYRIYFARDGGKLVIVLGGGTKKKQQADIAAAQRVWLLYKQMKLEKERKR